MVSDVFTGAYESYDMTATEHQAVVADKMLRYLVSYDDVNKVIKVIDKANIVSRAKEVFGVDVDVSVEYFDPEFGEYVEPSRHDEIPDEGKLRLVRRGPRQAPDLADDPLETSSSVVDW